MQVAGMTSKEIAWQYCNFACHSRHVNDPDLQQRLSSHQAGILDHLDEVEPITLSELAKLMGATPSTMSLSIKRLVHQGYVSKAKDSIDKRVTNLFITEAGVRLRERRSVLDRDKVVAVLEHLSPAEREQAINGLFLLTTASVKKWKCKVSLNSGSGETAKTNDESQEVTIK